jgi:hypothetical protein
MSQASKKFKVTYHGETKTTSNIMCFQDLVKFMFSVAQLDYSSQVPEGVDTKFGCDYWFNFWYEDAR